MTSGVPNIGEHHPVRPIEAPKDPEPSLAERVYAAAQVVTKRIAERNKKMRLVSSKQKRNAFLLATWLDEAHKDSVAMVEFANFLEQEISYLHTELARARMAEKALEIVATTDKKREEADEKAEPVEKLMVDVDGKRIETATAAQVVEKR